MINKGILPGIYLINLFSYLLVFNFLLKIGYIFVNL